MLVSGMVIGTAFTLFVVPSIYMLVARNRVAVASAVRSRTPEFLSWRRLYEHVLTARAAAFAAIAFLISTTVTAQAGRSEPLQLTLADAGPTRGRAQPGSCDRAVSIREAEAARVGEARGAYAPVFSTSFGRSRNVTPRRTTCSATPAST